MKSNFKMAPGITELDMELFVRKVEAWQKKKTQSAGNPKVIAFPERDKGRRRENTADKPKRDRSTLERGVALCLVWFLLAVAVIIVN